MGSRGEDPELQTGGHRTVLRRLRHYGAGEVRRVLALIECLVLAVIALLVIATMHDQQPEPEPEGPDLLDWAAENPGRTTCPDNPAEEGL
jgi:hypothetical protein